MNKQELDIWLEGCINYYNKKTGNNMAITIEERIKQLEQAHGRLFNQVKELSIDIDKSLTAIKNELSTIKESITPVDIVPEPLPDKLVEGKKYNAIIKEVISSNSIKWRRMDYTNWEVKLEGKEHIFLAFIKSKYQLEPGALVQFEYEHYLKLKHLKLV